MTLRLLLLPLLLQVNQMYPKKIVVRPSIHL
jgi:hypothetical protein